MKNKIAYLILVVALLNAAHAVASVVNFHITVDGQIPSEQIDLTLVGENGNHIGAVTAENGIANYNNTDDQQFTIMAQNAGIKYEKENRVFFSGFTVVKPGDKNASLKLVSKAIKYVPLAVKDQNDLPVRNQGYTLTIRASMKSTETSKTWVDGTLQHTDDGGNILLPLIQDIGSCQVKFQGRDKHYNRYVGNQDYQWNAADVNKQKLNLVIQRTTPSLIATVMWDPAYSKETWSKDEAQRMWIYMHVDANKENKALMDENGVLCFYGISSGKHSLIMDSPGNARYQISGSTELFETSEEKPTLTHTVYLLPVINSEVKLLVKDAVSGENISGVLVAQSGKILPADKQGTYHLEVNPKMKDSVTISCDSYQTIQQEIDGQSAVVTVKLKKYPEFVGSIISPNTDEDHWYQINISGMTGPVQKIYKKNTDNQGHFTMNLPEGKYTIAVHELTQNPSMPRLAGDVPEKVLVYESNLVIPSQKQPATIKIATLEIMKMHYQKYFETNSKYQPQYVLLVRKADGRMINLKKFEPETKELELHATPGTYEVYFFISEAYAGKAGEIEIQPDKDAELTVRTVEWSKIDIRDGLHLRLRK